MGMTLHRLGAVCLMCVAAMGLVAPSSHAADVTFSKAFGVCMDRSGGVTSAMLECNDVEMKKQDSRLNKAYKELMGQLTPARRKGLQDVQRLWLKYREANCSFYEDPDGGTIAAVQASDCFLTATAARAHELEALKY